MNVRYIGSGYLATLKTVARPRATVRVEKRASDIFAILETKLLKSKRLLAPHVQSSLMRV